MAYNYLIEISFHFQGVGIIETVLAGILAAVIGAGAGYFVRKSSAEKAIGSAEEEAKRIVARAEEQGEAKKKEALLEARRISRGKGRSLITIHVSAAASCRGRSAVSSRRKRTWIVRSSL